MSQPNPARQDTRPPAALYIANRPPGTSPDGQYLVLPLSQLQQLPVNLQHDLLRLLSVVHRYLAATALPVFQVTPSRWAPIDELDEDDLRSFGLLTELDAEGALIYRDRATLKPLSEAELARPVLVPLRLPPHQTPQPHQERRR